MLVNPVEYFEELPLYPEWIENSKLLFTWSAKKILEEDDKELQKSLIRPNSFEVKGTLDTS